MTSQNETVPGLYLLVGTGDLLALRQRRDLLLEAGVAAGALDVERINIAEDDPRLLLTAASAPALFGGPRVVVCEEFSQFPAELAGELGKALQGSDALVIGICDKNPAKAVMGAASWKVERFSVPKGAALVERVSELAARRGVSLTAAQRARLVKSGIEDWEALDDAFSKFEDLGGGPISETDLVALEAIVAGEAPPWDLSDAIERGDARGALRLLEGRQTPVFATLAYLANRARDLGLVVEATAANRRALSPEEIQKLCDIRHPFPAKKLGELARRTSLETLRRTWEVIASTDLALRDGSDPNEVVERAVVEMASLRR